MAGHKTEPSITFEILLGDEFETFKSVVLDDTARENVTTSYLRHNGPGDISCRRFSIPMQDQCCVSILVPGYVQQSGEAKGRQEQKGGSRSLEEMSPATYSTLPFFSRALRLGSVLYSNS